MSSDAPPKSPTVIPDFAALKRELSRSRKPELTPTLRTKTQRLLALFEDARATNVRAACERDGCSRPTYYKRWRKFRESGGDLVALLHAAQDEPHPLYTTQETKELIWQWGEEYPDMSPDAIARELAKEDIHCSGATVRAILDEREELRRNLRPRKQNNTFIGPIWNILDEGAAESSTLDESNVDAGLGPGSQVKLGIKLVQSVFFVRTATPLGIVYVHALVDPTSGHVWSAISPRKDVRDAVLLLQSTCDFYRDSGHCIEQVTTSERREFRGPDKPLPWWINERIESHRFFQVEEADLDYGGKETRNYWIRECELAGVDESGNLTAAATSAEQQTIQHRIYQAFLRRRGIKHDCPDHGAREGYTAEFDPDFKTFADIARDHFFAPWREHQKLLQSQGRPLDDLETLVLRFKQWVARYNDFVYQPSQTKM